MLDIAALYSTDRLIVGSRSWSEFYQQLLQLSSANDATKRRQQGDALERLT